eukprot:TRINITY_DN6437_c0_g1_i1.p1 TRINITY_DN6437_c0_g1~~TRINITY_DN6437_c0_g1_i1.p1  ORF type:complete len:352 (-),score=78.30 TRINITY_DN6437_c0_g1_i1:93-1148(-)
MSEILQVKVYINNISFIIIPLAPTTTKKEFIETAKKSFLSRLSASSRKSSSSSIPERPPKPKRSSQPNSVSHIDSSAIRTTPVDIPKAQRKNSAPPQKMAVNTKSNSPKNRNYLSPDTNPPHNYSPTKLKHNHKPHHNHNHKRTSQESSRNNSNETFNSESPISGSYPSLPALLSEDPLPVPKHKYTISLWDEKEKKHREMKEGAIYKLYFNVVLKEGKKFHLHRKRIKKKGEERKSAFGDWKVPDQLVKKPLILPILAPTRHNPIPISNLELMQRQWRSTLTPETISPLKSPKIFDLSIMATKRNTRMSLASNTYNKEKIHESFSKRELSPKPKHNKKRRNSFTHIPRKQ